LTNPIDPVHMQHAGLSARKARLGCQRCFTPARLNGQPWRRRPQS